MSSLQSSGCRNDSQQGFDFCGRGAPVPADKRGPSRGHSHRPKARREVGPASRQSPACRLGVQDHREVSPQRGVPKQCEDINGGWRRKQRGAIGRDIGKKAEPCSDNNVSGGTGTGPRGRGARLIPQFPTMTVVIPWLTFGTISGDESTSRSSCVWTSMKPGATTKPSTGISCRAGPDTEPTATIRPFRTPRSDARAGDPFRPPRHRHAAQNPAKHDPRSAIDIA